MDRVARAPRTRGVRGDESALPHMWSDGGREDALHGGDAQGEADGYGGEAARPEGAMMRQNVRYVRPAGNTAAVDAESRWRTVLGLTMVRWRGRFATKSAL